MQMLFLDLTTAVHFSLYFVFPLGAAFRHLSSPQHRSALIFVLLLFHYGLSSFSSYDAQHFHLLYCDRVRSVLYHSSFARWSSTFVMHAAQSSRTLAAAFRTCDTLPGIQPSSATASEYHRPMVSNSQFLPCSISKMYSR